MSVDKTAAAIYIAGHGSLVRPRLIELQYCRIQRYRDALRQQLDTKVSKRDVFVDHQLPKFGMGRFEMEDVPAFARLRDLVAAGRYEIVFIDVDETGPGRTPDYESDFVRLLLTEAGARVFNAFADDGNVFQKALKDRFGPTAWADEVADGTDFVCFFPSLTSEIGEAILRSELSSPAATESSRSRISQRLNSLKTARPYNGGKKPFVEDDLRRAWQKRQKE